MADTGAPWNIPYVEPTDVVRDYPAADEAQALAVAGHLTDLDTAIDAAGGLVAVKHVLKTDAFVSSGTVDAGGNVAVTGLEITHEVADPDNRLIISAFFGVGNASSNRGSLGIAIHDGAGLIAIGDAAGSRVRVSAGGMTTPSAADHVNMPAITFVHTPGAGEKTYTVRAVNVFFGAGTIFVNRNANDSNSATNSRGVSSLVIQEVKV